MQYKLNFFIAVCLGIVYKLRQICADMQPYKFSGNIQPL